MKQETVYAVVDTREGMSDVVSLHRTKSGAEAALRKAREDDPNAKRGTYRLYEYFLID